MFYLRSSFIIVSFSLSQSINKNKCGFSMYTVHQTVISVKWDCNHKYALELITECCACDTRCCRVLDQVQDDQSHRICLLNCRCFTDTHHNLYGAQCQLRPTEILLG